MQVVGGGSEGWGTWRYARIISMSKKEPTPPEYVSLSSRSIRKYLVRARYQDDNKRQNMGKTIGSAQKQA